jgi:hypothetical protein
MAGVGNPTKYRSRTIISTNSRAASRRCIDGFGTRFSHGTLFSHYLYINEGLTIFLVASHTTCSKKFAKHLCISPLNILDIENTQLDYFSVV